MNITITGNLGAGKTTICKFLNQSGYEIISTGKIFRQIADEKGITVLEMNELAKTDPSVDKMIDDRSVKLGKEKDNAIFDSRMAWHFIPDSFKVFLLADTNESGRRVLSDTERNAEKYSSIEEATRNLYERMSMERARFKELYDVDYLSKDNFNLIIDSTAATPEQISKEIIRRFEEYKKEPFVGKVELCVANVYPTESFEEFSSLSLDGYLEKEKDNDSFCSSSIITCVEQKGNIFMVDGHHRAMASAKSGKPFIEVKVVKDDVEVKPLSEDELKKYEKTGNITYKYLPSDNVNEGYLFDF